MKLNHFLIDGLSAIDDLDYIGMKMFAESVKNPDKNYKARIDYYNNKKWNSNLTKKE